MAKHGKLEIILKIGAEGGSLTILGAKSPDGRWCFCLEKNEAAMADLLSDEDRAGFAPQDFHCRSAFMTSFADALKLIDRFPWHELYPLTVHPEFVDRVLAEVERRGGQAERWKALLRGRERKMAIIAGVDGCRGGWICIRMDQNAGGAVTSAVFASAKELLLQEPMPDVIAIDIPIGLTDEGRRQCDQEARKLLGMPRQSSVFPAPIRPALGAESRLSDSTITSKRMAVKSAYSRRPSSQRFARLMMRCTPIRRSE